ncbi:conserved protein, unknown function [Hepatocystis sp. ex Piliocolobus tephrosceles]|nr:conserved protein, unknown function [Hepatocystis sp. ex Piliocolobus tephrosceles]
MLQYMQERRKYGNRIPKTLSSRINKSKIIQKNVCSNYKTIKIIDINENLSFNKFSSKKNKIKEIILAGDIVVVLLVSGISRAYDVIDGRYLCELNPSNVSVVHTVVYNTYNNTLIVAYASFPAHLQCKVINCDDLKNGKTNSAKIGVLFEKVILNHPAFFEFCETNRRIGAANLNANLYTFWDMCTYKKVFQIEEEFQEIRVSDGLLAMFKQPVNSTISLALFDIENGERLVETVIYILPRRELQFLELLVSKLLIKQEGSSVRIYDLLKKTKQKVKDTYSFQPIAFVFYDHPSPVNGKVYHNQISKKFFTVSNNLIEFWDLDTYMLRKMYSIQVPGLKNPDLYNHSLMTEIICMYSSDAFVNIQQNKKINDYVKCITTAYETVHNNTLQQDKIKTEKEKRNYENKKNILSNTFRNIELRNSNNTKNIKLGAILFFSLNDGEFLNYITEHVCGSTVEVLTSNDTMTTIICGDDKGVIRIIRNNPKFDDFAIGSDIVEVTHADAIYQSASGPTHFCFEDEKNNFNKIKRRQNKVDGKEISKKSKIIDLLEDPSC